MLSHRLESMIDVLGWVHILVNPDELLIVKEEAHSGGVVVGMRNLKAVTHRAIGIAEQREVQLIFFRKGELLGNGIHRDPDSAQFGCL